MKKPDSYQKILCNGYLRVGECTGNELFYPPVRVHQTSVL